MRTLEPSVSWQAVGGTHNRPILYALLIFGKSQGTYKQISHLESLLPCLEFWEFVSQQEGRRADPWSQLKLLETSTDLGAQRKKQEALGTRIDLTQEFLGDLKLAKAESVIIQLVISSVGSRWFHGALGTAGSHWEGGLSSLPASQI